MRRVEVVISSPCGNITALVLSAVPRAEQPAVALAIMDGRPMVEQVGFVEPPSLAGSLARLQNMGAELCGNGLCALAWHLAEVARGHGQELRRFALDGSGVEGPVEVEVGERVRARLSLAGTRVHPAGGDRVVVELGGIVHLVVRNSSPPDLRRRAAELLAEHGLSGRQAVGVLFCDERAGSQVFTPVVSIRDTGTLTVQSACGSGSLAVAAAAAAGGPAGRTELALRWASGGVIEVVVERGEEGFRAGSITTVVETLERGELLLADGGGVG